MSQQLETYVEQLRARINLLTEKLENLILESSNDELKDTYLELKEATDTATALCKRSIYELIILQYNNLDELTPLERNAEILST